MIRRVPIIPTIIVLAAVATMVALGFWQLGRLREKESLLAQYERAVAMSSKVVLPHTKDQRKDVIFRRTNFGCPVDPVTSPRAGKNARGQVGWVFWATCEFSDGSHVEVNIGWKMDPTVVHYAGGAISGIIAPDGPNSGRVVATVPIEGLEQSAIPNPNDIPNNHFSYAIQWFLFAATALVIYVLALRKRLAGGGAPR